jgi:hypothetical protein
LFLESLSQVAFNKHTQQQLTKLNGEIDKVKKSLTWQDKEKLREQAASERIID